MINPTKLKECQVEPKVFETRAYFKILEQRNRGKDKKKPYTKFVLITPYVDNKQFSELCRNDGYRITLKIEYLPHTKKIEHSNGKGKKK